MIKYGPDLRVETRQRRLLRERRKADCQTQNRQELHCLGETTPCRTGVEANPHHAQLLLK